MSPREIKDIGLIEGNLATETNLIYDVEIINPETDPCPRPSIK
jgi:hypothetical protein